MDTNALKKFAQAARRQLMSQVEARMQQVLSTDSVELREKSAEINQLRAQIDAKGKPAVIEEVAYTWFNRLCALRYMDVNHYTPLGIVSPAAGFTQPEVLQNAKQGIFEPGWQLNRARIHKLLSGELPSNNPDQEVYRMLLVAACNSYAREMDFLFEAISDYTELLMPEDLLSSESVLQAVCEALTPETCQDVEVIGWLYQFYISEKKDDVMAKKSAVKKEDIPAVTQLFTPDWIVRYMVQNSLGRLWLLNYPASGIRAQMEYYIPPSEPETDFLQVTSPEDLKILDPACGSGHILTYAFDLLYAIYEEQGYDPASIPQLILEKNLYGIEIDKRAAMLSSFALLMKALSRDKRFFRRGIRPNILEMEDVDFSPAEIKAYMAKLGQDLWTQNLWEGLQQFENAKTFGSLIRPVIKDVPTLRERMQSAGVFGDLFLSHTNDKMEKVLQMSEYLTQRYQVVVANPPYMGEKNLNSEIKSYAGEYYPDFKSDLFAMFIQRGFELIMPEAYNAMVTMQSWMFLSSFEKMRNTLLTTSTIISMVHMANMVMGIAFGTSATIWKKIFDPDYKGNFSYVNYEDLDNTNRPFEFPVRNNRLSTASAEDFKKIPGAPIAYWLHPKLFTSFEENDDLSNFGEFKHGMSTSDNSRFLRLWFEVDLIRVNFFCGDKDETFTLRKKWYPYQKGGSFRKWYGNQEYIVNWQNDGQEIRDISNEKYPYLKGNLDFVLGGQNFFFNPGYSWTSVSSGIFSIRKFSRGFIFDSGGQCFFPNNHETGELIFSLLNSLMAMVCLEAINPTINFGSGSVSKIPFNSQLINNTRNTILSNANLLVDKSMQDWNSYETSWEFTQLPLLKAQGYPIPMRLSERYQILRAEWQAMTFETQHLEEENNRIFIDAYGLQDELSPEVPLDEITLTCNPHYRYKGNYTEAQLEARLLEDTMKEFISYAVGCMFGRYALDKPGLILANQGETLQDYLRILETQPTFKPTETNVIPILDGDWFTDDILARFKTFLKITFGEPNYEENLRFIEDALGKDLGKYFLKDFYKDHVQTYKKRPIYWLFSSPKGSFNALVYMHRYHPDTISVVLNQYLRPYRDKLSAQRRTLENLSTQPSASAREKSQALKEIETVNKILAELKAYEDNVLYPLAAQRIAIDLDDGVVVNYAKFGDALKKI